MFFTDKDDIYTYFEVIRQLRPSLVLDVGMFLKRCGAIARQVADSSIDPKIRLVGIDFFPDFQIPIYETIYDEIYPVETLSDVSFCSRTFDLAIALSLPEGLCLLEELPANYLLTDIAPTKNGDTWLLNLNDRSYYLIQNRR